jgi:hypothetical protein
VLKLRITLTGVVIITAFVLLIAGTPSASAQTQLVQASKGYINLGMTTNVLATAPAAASYELTVVQPDGAKASLNLTSTAPGQLLNATYGNSTLGFRAVVNQVGTYNIFLQQGNQIVSSTSFYATNKLQILMQMVTGGTCDYVSGITRGEKMFPHTYITYASDGAPWTNTVKGASVNVTLPDGQTTSEYWDPYSKAWEAGVLPNWNYTSVGPWSPVINASDAAGNSAEFKYTESPFTISPAELNTSIEVTNATSGQPVTSLLSGETVTIMATITYPTNAEPVAGFVGPLSPSRGGSVAAQVGWGYYNATSGTFGGKMPGALIGTVSMTYTGSNGTWSGQFASTSLPTLSSGTTYVVVVSSKDGASPANTGLGIASLSPGAQAVTILPTTTTETATQTIQTIPDIVYGALVILLIVGILIGYIVRLPKARE